MVGRFISRDPLGFHDGPNRYIYVQNNPINWTDPSGLAAVTPGLPDHVNPNGSHDASDLLDGIRNNLDTYAQRNADAAAERAINAVERTMDCGTRANYMIIYGTFPVRFVALEPAGQASLTTQGVRRVPRTLRGIRGCECR
jgi:uncharacterized protein RhaS with RHS repeats